MTSSITQSFSICTHDYISPLENDLSKVDRGKSKKETIIQFQQENIKDVDALLLRLLKNNPEFLPGKAVSACSDTRGFYSENKNKILSNPRIDSAQPIKELISKQIESTVVEMEINKQIEELRNNNKLKFFPMNPDIVAINFDFDNNNNLIMYQKLQYKEYARYTPNGADTEKYVVCKGEDPYVTVDYYVKFSPEGDIINDGRNLEIQFNGCGDDLKAVFDKRSLWDKICDYFREVFNFHSDISGINFMAPGFNSKRVDESGEKNNLIIPEGKIEFSTFNCNGEDVSMEKLFPGLDKIPADNFDKITIALNSELNLKIEAEREKLKKYNE